MDVAPKPITVGTQATVSEAKLAYFEGDFDRCLDVCAGIRVRSLATASEVALLSARAYLRTGRAREAEVVLRDSTATHVSLDASLTAQMLLGAARIRQGDCDTGISTLEDAASRSENAHFAIRAEIAFSTALGYWAKRDIAMAEAYLAQVDPRADIIHARALDLQAWCHDARGDHRQAANLFLSALFRLDTCNAQDRAIAATAICSLSIYSAELFDPEMARVVEARASRMDWSSGLAAQQYLTLAHQAQYHEFAGNTVAAMEFALQAREMAPSASFEVFGWSLCAALSRNAGEANAAVVYAKRGQKLLATLDTHAFVGEERFSMLVVAENCAAFDVDTATELLAQYWGLTPADQMLALTGDPRLAGEETYVAGVVSEARGDRDGARACYRKAFEIFSPIGYVRRAAAAACGLVRLGEDEAARQYILKHTAGTQNHITAELRRWDGRMRSVERHPVVATLPRAQREVVSLVCAGKSNREIAQLRKVREQTIKNMLSKHVFRAFGVSSRAALVSSCLSCDLENATLL